MINQWIQPKDKKTLLESLNNSQGVLLGGGTDLLVQWRKQRREGTFEDNNDQVLIDLSQLKELTRIDTDGKSLRVGAMVSYQDLIKHPLIKEKLPVLAKAASQVGSPQIRARGTLGGSLGNGSPAADMAPLWVLLGAQVVLESVRGVREVGVADFLQGDNQDGRQKDEAIIAIHCPIPEAKSILYKKVARRNAAAITRFTACAMDDKQGLRLVVGAVTPTPLDCSDLLEDLSAGHLDADQIEKIAKQIIERIEGISGRRASAVWKFPAVENVAKRLLISLKEGGEPHENR